jgi:phage terminase large subunit
MFKFKPTKALYKIKALLKNISRVFVISGGQGAGKTISILMLIIDYAHRNEKKKISIISAELSKMKKTVIKDFLDIMQDWNMIQLGRWNISENTFTFKNGTFIEFLGLDTHDVGKGMRRDVVYFNEANKLNQEAYRQVGSRCKLNIIDFNPDKRFWGHDLIDTNNFINLTFKDNEYLSKEETESILEYYKKGYSENGIIINEYWANVWRVYGLGEIGSVEGRIFTHFKPILYPEYLEINLQKTYAIDWGKNHGFGIVEGKFDRYYNNLYTHELNYKSENKLISELTDYDKVLINNNENGGIIIYTVKKLNIPKDAVIVCDSAVPDNIRLLRNHGWEYAYGIDKPKGSVMAGISLLQSTNVFYTDCSSGIEHEHQTYQYRADRMGVVDDEVLKENDDLIDPIRYLRRHYEKN